MSNELPVWDLGLLFSGVDDPNINKTLERLLPAVEGFETKWRGKVAAQEAAGLLEAIKDYERVSQIPIAPYVFAHLAYSADTRDNAVTTLLGKIRELVTDAHRKTIFFTLELDKIEAERFDALLKDPLLADYSHFLTQLRKQKDRHLTEPEESILTLKSLAGKTAFVQLYSKLTNGFLFPSPLPEDGDKELSGSEILAFLKHPDREVRRKAQEIYAKAYEDNQTVIASVWNAIALDHRQNVELRGYDDIMAPVDEGNELSRKAVDTVMAVTRENYHLAQRYYRWKRKTLGFDKLLSSDLVAPFTEGEEEKIEYETAKKWVLEAFADFHPDFHTIAKAFFDEKRIDVPTKPGKSGGAFCMGAAPNLPVYVLTNFTGKLRDAATIAHELGHGIHFTLAAKQPFLEYGPVLPVAETASVFGELLLTNKLLKRDLDPIARRNLIAGNVEDIIATTFRQTMYTDFELSAHQRTAKEFVSPEAFCEIWENQLHNLYDDSVESLPAASWSWSAIPHFIHTRFYCYAYTFGELLVLALYRRYQEEGDAFAPKLIKLLEAGGSKEPQELVSELGYDLEDPAFWSGGYKVLEDLLDDLEGM